MHPCGIRRLHIDALPSGASRAGALYPDGATIEDLKEARDLVNVMNRPGIAPEVKFPYFPFFAVGNPPDAALVYLPS